MTFPQDHSGPLLTQRAAPFRPQPAAGGAAERWGTRTGVNGEVSVITNMGQAPVALPPGEVLMASGDILGNGTLPVDTTVWMVAPYTG